MKLSRTLVVFILAILLTPTAIYMLSIVKQQELKEEEDDPHSTLVSGNLLDFNNHFYPPLPEGLRFRTSVSYNFTIPSDSPGKNDEPTNLDIGLNAEFWSASVIKVPIMDSIEIRVFLPGTILHAKCERTTQCNKSFSISSDVQAICIDGEVKADGVVHQSAKACGTLRADSYSSSE